MTTVLDQVQELSVRNALAIDDEEGGAGGRVGTRTGLELGIGHMGRASGRNSDLRPRTRPGQCSPALHIGRIGYVGAVYDDGDDPVDLGGLATRPATAD